MIQYKKLIKSFGTRTILKGIDLHIKAGEIVFILGTSGTGKSVLLKNTVGLMKPDSGEIWIDDENVTDFTEQQFLPVRKKCGMVFQHPALFDSLSIYENIAFGLRKHFVLPENEIKERVEQALSLVNLENVLTKRPGEISYGMQKRVSLARTVVLRPKVLLFDEPTTGLDPVTTNSVNSLIQNLSRKLNTTSMVVSHDMHCALKIADRIVVLDQGQIVDQGTPQELLQSQVPLVRDFLSEARDLL
ncbi:MAG: ABC transporter ATP-binding protein [Bdellovibrionaceae bacterium]|nr:ABC transporter ATP-binding protein [Pseudobdellovibrionaceae bacterium]